MMNCEYPEFDESILTPSGTEVVCPVKTTPLHEFKFRDYCRENGVVSYLPLRRTWKVHNLTSNGKAYNYSKEVLRPMFMGYVFVKTQPEELRKLFESKQIVRILPVPDLPAFGIFWDQGSNPCSLIGGFLTTEPPGKPSDGLFRTCRFGTGREHF